MKESTTLYYRQGTSDKVYQASIEEKGSGYVVNFAYGRHGSAMSTGTKTPEPIPYEHAKAIYDKLISEKTAKGYTPGEDGTLYQHTDKVSQTTGIHCQLLNPVEEEQVEKLIADPSYWMQEKHDGGRLLIKKEGETITGINRLGLAVALPESLVKEAARCPFNFIIDGETISGIIHVFDLLQVGDEQITGLRYRQRYLRLMNLLASFQHRHISLVRTAFDAKQKHDLFKELKAQLAEGVVFKQIDSPYTAGRPSSGGSQLKYKFCETASFIIGKVNVKRSVSLLLFHGDTIVEAGNVTIPPNQEIPTSGQIVECQYLYAFRESGCIYQPVYLGKRDDIIAEECTTTQLKYKAEPEEKAA
ncbi:ATP-dependent DNA ligase [Verrucomicrobiota bacterium sgz303538]